jgi:hypothetical protein
MNKMANGLQENAQRPNGAATAENEQQAAANAADNVWDEERLEKAMSTLKEMHIQVSHLLRSRFNWSLITNIAAQSTNYHPKTHCSSDGEATITYAKASLSSRL